MSDVGLDVLMVVVCLGWGWEMWNGSSVFILLIGPDFC